MVDLREIIQFGDGSEEGLPDTVKHWIDDKVHKAGLKIYRGGLQVLASGFGKGLLAAAAITIIASVALAVSGGGGLPVATLVDQGLMKAGSFLLGSTGGATVLAVGGLLGAVVETQHENTKVTKQMAEAEAKRFETLRSFKDSRSFGLAPTQNMEQEPAASQENCGHCAKLLQERAANQNRPKGGIA